MKIQHDETEKAKDGGVTRLTPSNGYYLWLEVAGRGVGVERMLALFLRMLVGPSGLVVFGQPPVLASALVAPVP